MCVLLLLLLLLVLLPRRARHSDTRSFEAFSPLRQRRAEGRTPPGSLRSSASRAKYPVVVPTLVPAGRFLVARKHDPTRRRMP